MVAHEHHDSGALVEEFRGMTHFSADGIREVERRSGEAQGYRSGGSECHVKIELSREIQVAKVMLSNAIWLTAWLLLFGSKFGGDHNWSVVDDRVMGGVSQSQMEVIPEGIRWSGTLSYEQNGGFASIRSAWKPGCISGMKRVRMRVRGSADEFAFRMSSSQRYYDPVAEWKFNPTTDWSWMDFDLEESEITVLGQLTGGTLDPRQVATIARLGFMRKSGDAGPFWLEVSALEFE